MIMRLSDILDNRKHIHYSPDEYYNELKRLKKDVPLIKIEIESCLRQYEHNPEDLFVRQEFILKIDNYQEIIGDLAFEMYLNIYQSIKEVYGG